ncbi:P-loop NTPase fold protein [Brevibacterium sp. 1718]|uniref:YobI family P-loop NTPase n=1 Tax=Brevibacterium sp. 1718 TaxID=3413510 RepID=UPI003DA7DAEC
MSQNQRTGRATQVGEQGKTIEPADPSNKSSDAAIELRSLAPEYNEEQHAIYVRHLETAVREPKNRNIALTGRYGSGKSSILDRFIENQEKAHQTTLRISINTLGPDDGEAVTNRIQKELVKQLVYRAEPGKIRYSRFARRKEPTKRQMLLEAVVVGVPVFCLLWLFGVRPEIDALGTNHIALPAIAFLILLVGVIWTARWFIGNRPVSQFSTGGTSISFDKQPDSYFDEYLDEIMAFFEAKKPNLVVFEDIDRFDDPRIFDSLRELNTLINDSAQWKNQEQPLRFIYAIKDSLFEKLGDGARDTNISEDSSAPSESDQPPTDANSVSKRLQDTAEAAVERANRTKFFETVIPVVPFLSHSNARDLLSAKMDELKLPKDTKISRGLLDIVARHTTDMRLLLNVRNEFVIFAERLLWINENDRAPRLTANDLFALVVYKNFHLADFETLPNRGSALDQLESKRQKLVEDTIAKLQNEKHELLRSSQLQGEQENTAQRLVDRLIAFAANMKQEIQRLTVGEQSYTPDAARTSTFWKNVSKVGQIELKMRSRLSGHESASKIGRSQLNDFFPELKETSRWEILKTDLDQRCADLDHKVAVLRGADFNTLAKQLRLESFLDSMNSVLPSQLAFDLVVEGYLNRYYAEYSTVFYGGFLGVDVANFFRNCVWPNGMKVQDTFVTNNAVQNILDQAPEGFTRSRSALNIQIIDHLLEHRPQDAKEVVSFLADESNEQDRATFLHAFLNETSSRSYDLVSLLAKHPWQGLFDYLASPKTIATEASRTELLDAAILGASSGKDFEISDKASALITDRYSKLKSFTSALGHERAAVVMDIIHLAGIIIPSLDPLSTSLLRRVVDDDVYDLTAENVRAALALGTDDPISLDYIRQDDRVWKRCLEEFSSYLLAVDRDASTEYATLNPAALQAVIQTQYEEWTDEQIVKLLETSAPTASLSEIANVPTDTWPMIASARRLEPNVKNLHTYSTEYGVDEHLAKVLMVEPTVPDELDVIIDVEPQLVAELRLRILNASHVLKSRERVYIALQLDPELTLGGIDAADIKPTDDNLLADLLEAGLVPDTANTFKHFMTAGWNAIANAFHHSEAAKEFLTPELVADHALSLLRDFKVPNATKAKLVTEIGEYATENDEELLREGLSYAFRQHIQLPLPQLEQVAPYALEAEHVLRPLAALEDLASDDALRVLGKLGGDYEGFNAGPGHETEVPLTDSIRTILNRLKLEGRVELPRGGRRGTKKVKLV